MPRYSFSWAVLLLFVTVVVFIPGCGEPQLKGLYPVKGKITHNGTPLAGVTISLMPVNHTVDSRGATAMSAADGTFTVRTLKPNDGAFPGEYRVILTKLVFSHSEEQMAELAAKGVDYNITSTNIMPAYDQIITVKTGKNELVIDVTNDLIVPKYKWYREKLTKQN